MGSRRRILSGAVEAEFHQTEQCRNAMVFGGRDGDNDNVAPPLITA